MDKLDKSNGGVKYYVKQTSKARTMLFAPWDGKTAGIENRRLWPMTCWVRRLNRDWACTTHSELSVDGYRELCGHLPSSPFGPPMWLCLGLIYQVPLAATRAQDVHMLVDCRMNMVLISLYGHGTSMPDLWPL